MNFCLPGNMEFTIKKYLPALLLFISIFSVDNLLAASLPGLNTREQNPMLQAYYIPGISSAWRERDGWLLSQSLFITNTYQRESASNETLIIDSENYRYDLSIGYQYQDWQLSTRVSLISNEGGKLDSVIEDWHDLFGLPQNGRTGNPDDRLNMQYSRNGILIFQQHKPKTGIGDIALSVGYQLYRDETSSRQISFGIELPTGDVKKSTGNDAIDFALWLDQVVSINQKSRLYGLIGISRPGNGGQLQSLLKSNVWFGQLGVDYTIYPGWTGIVQVDVHSKIVSDSELTAFGNSMQIQLGLKLENWLEQQDINLFFAEDILVGSAPDISFGVQLTTKY